MEYLYSNFFWLLLGIAVVFIFAYKRLSGNPDAITSKFEAIKKISGSPDDNLEIIEQALKNSSFKKVGLNRDENRFYAQTSFSMWSFSEYIEVSFRKEPSSTLVKFKSICALPTQVIDWGKNKRNYRRFEKELEKLLPSPDVAELPASKI